MRGGGLQEVSKYSDLTWKLLVFCKNWSLRRGGRNRRFDCAASESLIFLVLQIVY